MLRPETCLLPFCDMLEHIEQLPLAKGAEASALRYLGWLSNPAAALFQQAGGCLCCMVAIRPCRCISPKR